MLKALSMLCFTLLASCHAAEHRIIISPLLADFSAKLKNTSKKVEPAHEVNLSASSKELSDKDVLLLAKYSLLDRDSKEIFSSDFPFACSPAHKSRAAALCKTSLSKKIDSRVSKVASILLDLNSQHFLFDAEATATLKSLSFSSCKGSISASLLRLACLDKFVSKTPILVPQQSARITSHFGSRQVFKRRIGHHKGTDMTSPKMLVYAAADGVVVSCSWMRGYGNILTIDHGGTRTRYAHLSKFYVKPGATVKQGQEIAAEGATGRVRGRHLHFEVLLHGKHVDPMSFIACSMKSSQILISQAVLSKQRAACHNSVPQKFAVAKLSSKTPPYSRNAVLQKSATAKFASKEKIPALTQKQLTDTNSSTFANRRLALVSTAPKFAAKSNFAHRSAKPLPATRVVARSRSTALKTSLPVARTFARNQGIPPTFKSSIASKSFVASKPRVFARNRPVFKTCAIRGGAPSHGRIYVRARY
jgi:hypothetical protein